MVRCGAHSHACTHPGAFTHSLKPCLQQPLHLPTSLHTLQIRFCSSRGHMQSQGCNKKVHDLYAGDAISLISSGRFYGCSLWRHSEPEAGGLQEGARGREEQGEEENSPPTHPHTHASKKTETQTRNPTSPQPPQRKVRHHTRRTEKGKPLKGMEKSLKKLQTPGRGAQKAPQQPPTNYQPALA